MKIVISSGHSQHVRGASGVLDEVNEARRVVDAVAGALHANGHGAEVFHDDVSTTQSANLRRIVDFHNGEKRDLDVSIHFNCFNGTASGCECLYLSQAALAQQVADAICAAAGFKNRGGKKRTNLAFLNNTDAPAILIEICFVDSSEDATLYNAAFAAICTAIAETICSHN